MCWQDYLLGKYTRGQIIQFSLTTTPTEIIGASDTRRVLFLFPEPSTNYLVSFQGGTSPPHFNVIGGDNPIMMTRDIHGDIVSRSLWGYVSAGTLDAKAYIGELDEAGFWREVRRGSEY